MNVPYNLVVDFARPSKSNTIIISEGDVQSRTLHFTLLANKQPMGMLDVTTATVRGIKSDGSTIFGDADIIKDATGTNLNEIEYTLPAAFADTAGRTTMTITLMSSSGQMLTSFEFYIEVRNALYNEDDYISEEDLQGYRDLLNRSMAALEKIEDMTEKDALPNPFPINIKIEDKTYAYKGSEQVDIELKDIAYIDDDPVFDDELVDETAAGVASKAAIDARESARLAGLAENGASNYANNAHIAAENAEGVAVEVRNAVGMCEGYLTQVEEIAPDAIEKAQSALNTSNAALVQANTAAAKADTIINKANTAATRAENAETNATAKATEASASAISSKSYAVGGTGTRAGEDTDNAKYYYNQLMDLNITQVIDDVDTLKAEMPTKANVSSLSGKQDKLIAGDNITIENNVISSTGGGSAEWVGTKEDWANDTGSLPKSSLSDGDIINITNDYDEDAYVRADRILNTMEEITASTDLKNVAGASAVNELNNKVPFRLGVDENGNYGYYKDGADSVTPFRGGGGAAFTIRYVSPAYNYSTFSNQVQTDNSVARDVTKTLEDNEYFKVAYRKGHHAEIDYKKDCWWIGSDGVMTIRSSGNKDTFTSNFYASCPFTIIGA